VAPGAPVAREVTPAVAKPAPIAPAVPTFAKPVPAVVAPAVLTVANASSVAPDAPVAREVASAVAGNAHVKEMAEIQAREREYQRIAEHLVVADAQRRATPPSRGEMEVRAAADRQTMAAAQVDRERQRLKEAKNTWAKRNWLAKANRERATQLEAAALAAEILGRKKNAEELSIEEARMCDNDLERDPVARRLAVQKATTATQKIGRDIQWEEAFAHEPRERREIYTRPADVPAWAEKTSERAWRISLTPDVDHPPNETAKQTAARLDRHRLPDSNKDTEVSHIVLSLPDNGRTPTLGEMVALCRRMGSRIGVDWNQQETAGFVHCDTGHWHVHMLIGRTRMDGGRWSPGIGIDRALALEARMMAKEKGQEWEQRMVARSRHSKGAAALARRGELHAKIVYPDREAVMVAWQGAEADRRVDADWVAHAEHPGVSIGKQVGLRSAYRAAGYCRS
jgi:hypothetical protein